MLKYGELSRLSDLAAAEIDTLSAEGITLSPAEAVKINAICQLIEHPHLHLDLSRGCPVFIGATALWPYTLYGADWMERHEHLFRGERMQLWATAFAMAHGRTVGALDFPPAEAVKRVKRWVRSLPCTNEEIEAAIGIIVMRDEQPNTGDVYEKGGPSMGDLSSTMTALAGGDPATWEAAMSATYFFDVVRTIVQQNRADDKPSAGDLKLKYCKALANIISGVRKRHGK